MLHISGVGRHLEVVHERIGRAGHDPDSERLLNRSNLIVAPVQVFLIQWCNIVFPGETRWEHRGWIACH